ncbi:MAG: bifunctional diaminohydroxyphosphoribosylaminopyrimidine deaminase/5-amino-6-(5-phosphoribosylamino)uracil reductase RibD [Legionellales bacterium]
MHESLLLAALKQATYGQGTCAPNPCVGAVAVQNGIIIAQAWHQGAGKPHAEQLLLAQFPPKTPGVTVYCTLEPCTHWGRTPPCVDALIQHGIERLVFSYYDPNPLVAKNNASQKLRDQGIEVLHIPLPEVDEFYKSYSYWTATKKPRVTVKMAQTLDGKIAGPHGERIQLSNTLCDAFTQKMRAATDVILTTAKTVNSDNPQMNVRMNHEVHSKPVAILDGRLSIKKEMQIFHTASHCHIYHFDKVSVTYPNSSFYLIPEKNGIIDLAAVISHLGSLGFHDVWVEAGGAVFTALHRLGLVHRTYLYLVPNNLGPDAVSAYQQEGLFNKAHKVSWQAMGDNMILGLDWQEVPCLPD